MSSTIKIKAPAMPEPATTGLGDEYEAFDRDGKSMGKAYENVQYFSAAQLAARDAQWQEVVGPLLEIAEQAKQLLGGILGSSIKASEIPSNAASSVKARHLASLRDSLAALSAITEE